MKIPKFLKKALKLPPAVVNKCAGWKIAGSSLPGTAHRRRGKNCDDAAGWFATDDLLGIAVADGAGSAAHGAIGSALAVRTALKTLWNHEVSAGAILGDKTARILEHTCLTTMITLHDRAEEMGLPSQELASTLIVVVANRRSCAAAQIGDGAVVLYDQKGQLISLATPTNGEYANETILLGCSPSVNLNISILEDYPLKSIAVFSDGIQRLGLRMPEGEPHHPFFKPIFDRLEKHSAPEMEELITKFLDSPNVNARTDDDKTLVTAQLL